VARAHGRAPSPDEYETGKLDGALLLALVVVILLDMSAGMVTAPAEALLDLGS
jgi:hypothetical protein